MDWLNVPLLFSLFLWPFYAAPPIAWQSPSETSVNRVISSTGGQAEALPALPLVDASSPASPDYDLLVLAPEEFRPPLAALVAHKIRTGLSATLLTLEALYDDPRFLPAADEAEQIKKAIAYYEQHHAIKYVLLAGDVDRFPVRWVSERQKDNPDVAGIFIPSDLYYADLYDSDGAFDDWDADADGYYGEHGISSNCATNRYLVNIDHVDLHPDIAVGCPRRRWKRSRATWPR